MVQKQLELVGVKIMRYNLGFSSLFSGHCQWWMCIRCKQVEIETLQANGVNRKQSGTGTKVELPFSRAQIAPSPSLSGAVGPINILSTLSTI